MRARENEREKRERLRIIRILMSCLSLLVLYDNVLVNSNADFVVQWPFGSVLVSVYIYTSTHTHTHTHTHIYIHTHTRTYIHTYLLTTQNTYLPITISTSSPSTPTLPTHTHTHTLTHTHTHTHTHTGTTHFCDSCHRNCGRLCSTPKHKLLPCPCKAPRNGLPKKVDKCPLNIKHPPHGNEFALGNVFVCVCVCVRVCVLGV